MVNIKVVCIAELYLRNYRTKLVFLKYLMSNLLIYYIKCIK